MKKNNMDDEWVEKYNRQVDEWNLAEITKNPTSEASLSILDNWAKHPEEDPRNKVVKPEVYDPKLRSILIDEGHNLNRTMNNMDVLGSDGLHKVIYILLRKIQRLEEVIILKDGG